MVVTIPKQEMHYPSRVICADEIGADIRYAIGISAGILNKNGLYGQSLHVFPGFLDWLEYTYFLEEANPVFFKPPF